MDDVPMANDNSLVYYKEDDNADNNSDVCITKKRKPIIKVINKLWEKRVALNPENFIIF